jgi:hypothetical protein
MTRDEIVKYATVIAKLDGKKLIADCPCGKSPNEYGICGDPGKRLVMGIGGYGPYLVLPCEKHFVTYLQNSNTWEEAIV